MSLAELLRTALHSLRINPLRSVLSILGVIFGIAAVIVLISMGQGVRYQVTDQIKGLGTDLLVVRSGQEESTADAMVNPTAAAQGSQVRNSSLTEGDAEKLVAIDGIKTVSSTIEQWDRITGNGKAITCKVVSGDKNLKTIRKLSFSKQADGWSFEKQEPGTCSIGYQVAEKLFGGKDAIGQTVIVGQTSFTVKAVVRKRERSLFEDQNRYIYLPIAVGRDMYGAGGTDKVQDISITVKDPNSISAIKEKIRAALDPGHQQRWQNEHPGGEKFVRDFYVATQDDLMSSYTKILAILSALVLGVALVALTESGIGVSNIMYIAVKERTREIGVRLAQGASHRAILIQFLFESVTICLIGAAIGVPLGWLVSMFINNYTVLPARTPPWAILVAFGAATFVGIVAGVYPAWKATKADIAVALRSE